MARLEGVPTPVIIDKPKHAVPQLQLEEPIVIEPTLEEIKQTEPSIIHETTKEVVEVKEEIKEEVTIIEEDSPPDRSHLDTLTGQYLRHISEQVPNGVSRELNLPEYLAFLLANKNVEIISLRSQLLDQRDQMTKVLRKNVQFENNELIRQGDTFYKDCGMVPGMPIKNLNGKKYFALTQAPEQLHEVVEGMEKYLEEQAHAHAHAHNLPHSH